LADADDGHDAGDADDDAERRQERAQLVPRERAERDLEDVSGLGHRGLRPSGQRLVEDLERLVYLARAHDERWRDADDVAVETALADPEAALLRLLEKADGLVGRGRPVLNGLVGHELEALHEAHAAHVADRLRVLLLQLVEAAAQARA